MEYIIIIAKNSDNLGKLSIEKVSDATKKVINISNQVSMRVFSPGVEVKGIENGIIPKGIYTIKTMNVEYQNDIIVKNGRTANEVSVIAKFLNTQDKINEYIENDLLFITANKGLRRRVSEEESNKAKSITDLLIDWGDNQDSEKEQIEIFDNKYFEYTKPLLLLNNLTKSASEEDSIILDFFSGSATTAHAVMQLNAEDGGHRKFIMVQLPEVCDEKSEAAKAGYRTICEIGKERIRRAAKKIHEDNPDAQFDDGFKVFEVADTNIRWNTVNDEEIKSLSEMDYGDDKERIDFTKGYTDIDVVYEIMLRQFDIPLSTPVEKLPEVSDRTYIFADAVVVCLEPEITTELIEKLSAIEPTPAKFVLRDSAFNDDIQLKDVSFRRLSALIKNHQTEEERKSKYNNYTVEFI